MCGPRTTTSTFWGNLLLLANLFGSVISFTAQQHGTIIAPKQRVDLSMAGESDFFSKIPNPFFAKDGIPRDDDASYKSPRLNSESFETVGAEILIGKAKAVIATDLGIQDPNLLDESFIWIGPFLEKPLGKVDYLAAGRFFSLRAAFPDLDYRPHDFRVDENDPLTVRCTVRPLGVMRGSLRLRTELVQPNGKQWRGPPEAISLTFDADTIKVVKLCSGFAMDRLVGNTNGLCGVMAAATIAGVPPADWEVYPIPVIISRFFGRPVDPVDEVSTFLAPFPETVMIQLVKGILTTNLAADDPSLLAKDFSFITPLIGPIGKNKFLEAYARQEFGGFVPQFSHFRVDPFDPYRVWVDVKPVGPGLEGPPQAYSFTFDDDGFCTRITAGAVMDPSIGNTGGLTGAAGINYALGEGGVDLTVRPLPLAIGRLKKTILSPLTKIEADDYVLDSSKVAKRDGKPDLDPVEARKALNDARARLQEEEAFKRQMEIEEQVRVRTQQEVEQQKLRMRQEAEEELRKAREDMERDILRRQAEFRVGTQTEVLKVKPEFTIPNFTPLKLPRPPEITPPAFPAPPNSTNAATPNTGPPQRKQAPGKVFVDAIQSLADLSAPKSPSMSKRDADEKKKKEQTIASETKKADLEAKKAAAEEARARKAAEAKAAVAKAAAEEARARKAAEAKAAVAKAAAEEARARKAAEAKAAVAKAAAEEASARKAAEAKAAVAKAAAEEARARKAAEAKEAAAKAAAEKARARKAAEAKAAVAKKEKDTEERRKNAEKKPKEATSAGSNPFTAAFSNATGPRPSLQIPKVAPSKPAQKPPPSARRPSFPIPEFGKADMKTASEQTAVKARPSFQIPQLGKATENPTGTPSTPRPSLQKPKEQPPRPTFTIPIKKKAPNGIPTIVAWRKRPNGGISGQIFGSMNFKDGERVETSPIVSGELDNGCVVTTDSGSKYFLSSESVRDARAAAVQSRPKPQPVTTSKPRATLELTKKAKERDAKAAQAALEAASQAKSSPDKKRSTFSLATLFGMDQPSESRTKTFQSTTSTPSPKVSRSPVAKQAPKGVPTLSRWKENKDRSITGYINGSSFFAEGERVTTSPIARGTIASGEVVVTSSGSKYFLP